VCFCLSFSFPSSLIHIFVANFPCLPPDLVPIPSRSRHFSLSFPLGHSFCFSRIDFLKRLRIHFSVTPRDDPPPRSGSKGGFGAEPTFAPPLAFSFRFMGIPLFFYKEVLRLFRFFSLSYRPLDLPPHLVPNSLFETAPGVVFSFPLLNTDTPPHVPWICEKKEVPHR